MSKRKFLQVDYSSNEEENAESSDDEMMIIPENELVPIAKKKKPHTTTASNRSHTLTESQQATFKKKSTQMLKQNKGAKSVTVAQKIIEFDFDNIGVSDVSDSPRQVIVKKKHFPRNMVGYVTKASRIDFSKDKNKKERSEIVVDILFLFDVNDTKCVRSNGGEEIDYKEVSIRFHLPKRFQDIFEGMESPNALVGTLLMCPEFDQKKWINEKDEEKSSIPLIMLLKNTACYSKIGLTLGECPDYNDILSESKKMLEEEYVPSEAYFIFVMEFFRSQAKFFFARETHKSNRMTK